MYPKKLKKPPTTVQLQTLDKTISQMRLQLANIEAELVTYKENTEQTISELSQSIDTKDKEILTLKNTQRRNNKPSVI